MKENINILIGLRLCDIIQDVYTGIKYWDYWGIVNDYCNTDIWGNVRKG